MFEIIIKEIKQNLRNRKSLVIFIAFPLLLMWILSAVFSSSFSGKSLSFQGAKILYYSDQKNELYQGFESFKSEIEDMNIEFVETTDNKKAIKAIADNNYLCFIELNQQVKKILFTKNSINNSTASFIESLVNAYLQRFNLIYEIVETSPGSINKVINSPDINYVSLKSINGGAAVRSIDYYGITMLTLIIMYSVFSSSGSITTEQFLGTGDRILETPLPRYKFFVGKVLGSFLVTCLQMSIVILFSVFVLGVNWGNDITTVIVIIMSQILMCTSLGIGIGMISKKQEVAQGISNILIPLFIFLGGGYYPINNLGGKLLSYITLLSPIKWINGTILSIIHANDYSGLLTTLMINFGISLIVLILSSMSFRKREVL